MTFYTIDHQHTAETEAKGSRFIAVLVPMEQFDDTLAALRVSHRKASHHVTATRRMGAQGVEDHASDDGEPAGTSGIPSLKVLIGAGLVDAGAIVVRYFGGTKLGTGGLARAYSGAVAAALAEANPRPWHRISTRELTCGFADSSAIEAQISRAGITVLARDFTENGVHLRIEGPEALVEAISV